MYIHICIYTSELRTLYIATTVTSCLSPQRQKASIKMGAARGLKTSLTTNKITTNPLCSGVRIDINAAVAAPPTKLAMVEVVARGALAAARPRTRSSRRRRAVAAAGRGSRGLPHPQRSCPIYWPCSTALGARRRRRRAKREPEAP